jgi:glycosyltransferase involved in cell wall biosynthesis
MKPLYRLLTQFPNVTILNNSKSGARDYERWLNIPQGSLRVIHNGFDFSNFPAGQEVDATREKYLAGLGFPQDACVIGSVMRISEEKRPLLWLKMAEYVARYYPHVYFLIVGDGVMRDEMERTAISLGLSGKIKFVGHEKDALSAIAAMDVFVQTSRVEGLPNVLIEAQALGVPVVATDVGGTGETFVDGVTGFTARTDTPEDIANQVMKILSNIELRTQMKELASAKAKDEFSIEKMIARVINVYSI